MKMKVKVVLSLSVAALLGLSSPCLHAQQKVEARRSAAADALVEIDNPAGSITVTGWDRNEVVVTGDLGAGASGLEFTGSGSRLRVGVDTERNPHAVISSLEIHVPRRSRLQIESFAGSIAVAESTGTVAAETVNGSITIGGQAKEISAETVNGSVQISGASTHTRAESVNGSVIVQGASGELDASTVNGRLEVAGGSFERAHLETVSGALSFDGGLAAGATLEAETVSGQVTLVLPAGVAADFSISTFSGGIENALGPPATRVGEHTTERELEFSTGGGGASVSVHTLSGGITLRKK
jgi:hypothetical protein